jgi:hypothetical protein
LAGRFLQKIKKFSEENAKKHVMIQGFADHGEADKKSEMKVKLSKVL